MRRVIWSKTSMYDFGLKPQLIRTQSKRFPIYLQYYERSRVSRHSSYWKLLVDVHKASYTPSNLSVLVHIGLHHHHHFICPIIQQYAVQIYINTIYKSRAARSNKNTNSCLKHTHPFNGLFSGTTRRASTRKVKPIWILLKQETVSGSGISWAIRKSAPCSRQVTMPATHHSVSYRPDALPATQPTASKHWRDVTAALKRVIKQLQGTYS